MNGPCLVGHLEGVDVAASKYYLAALALSKIILIERGSDVEPEVDGTASEGKWAKARSSGNMGRSSWVCLQTWLFQAEALYQCILGFSLPLQYIQAKVTFRWLQRMWLQADAFCEKAWVQSGNWHL